MIESQSGHLSEVMINTIQPPQQKHESLQPHIEASNIFQRRENRYYSTLGQSRTSYT